MYSKIKVYNIIKGLIILAMMFALSLFKPIGGVFAQANMVKVIVMVLVICSFILTIFINRKRNQFVSFTVALWFFLLIVSFFITKATKLEYFRGILNYTYILATIPIYYLLAGGYWELNKLLDVIVNLTTISYLLRIGISMAERMTGIVFFPSIALESAASNWYRNGVLRLNPPCFGIIIIPVLIYLFLETTEKKKRIYYISIILLAIYYSFRVHAARSLVAYQIIEVLFMCFFSRKSTKKQIVLITIISIVGVWFVNSSIFENFINTFNTVNGVYSYSSRSRLMSFNYYLDWFFRNPILGTGILPEESHYVVVNTSFGELIGALGDLGIMYTILRFGLGAILFYVAISFYGIKCALRARKENTHDNIYLLVGGIVLSIILTGINIDIFFAVYAFSVPFCVAIMGYSGEIVYHTEVRNIYDVSRKYKETSF